MSTESTYLAVDWVALRDPLFFAVIDTTEDAVIATPLPTAGIMNEEIAGSLSVSARTAEKHRAAARHILQLRSVMHLVKFAIRNGLL